MFDAMAFTPTLAHNGPQRHGAHPGPGDRPAHAQWRSRAALAAMALAVALVGGGAALAIGLATGALHTTGSAAGKAATVTRLAPAPAGGESVSREGWAPVYSRVAPSTVDVIVRSDGTVSTPFGAQREPQTTLGSGMVLDGAGHILTAAHVVAGATSVTVTFQDGVRRGAKVLGADSSSDVAVLGVSPAGLSLYPVGLGSSRSVAVGAPVGVIGDPLGFDRSLSTGVVSALDRTIEAPNGFQVAHAIQIDAALNPGNSGGPVLNARGRVIGISDQIAVGTNQFGHSTSETSTGVGFVVPIDLVKAELAQLKRGEHVVHAYLGVATGTSEQADRAGAFVQEVRTATPAASAGLRPGDVIVAFDGARIAGANDLIDALAGARAGARATVTVLRGSERLTFEVTLAAQPARAVS
jgi:S1-C subfamily serine protease